jgi:P4 family phage/plasmid primase-like protien
MKKEEKKISKQFIYKDTPPEKEESSLYKLIGKEEDSSIRDLEEDADLIAEHLRALMNPDDDKAGKLNIHELADVIIEEQKDLYHIKTPIKRMGMRDIVIGTFYYDGVCYRDGSEILPMQLRRIIEKLGLERYYRRYAPIEAEYKLLLKRKTQGYYNIDTKLVLHGDLIFDWEAFVNGIEPFCYPPSPDYFVIHRLPHKLDIDIIRKYNDETIEYSELCEAFRDPAKGGTVISKYFEDWVDDKYPFLLEITGYDLLAGSYPLHKANLLKGDGSNGKSVFLKVKESILGEGNVSHLPLQALISEEGRFLREQLYMKMANIFADLPENALKRTGIFKMLTGEDTLIADRKGTSPIEFVSYAKCTFSTNKFPKVYDLTFAFARRWNVMDFPHVFPEDNSKKKAILELADKEAPKIKAFAYLAIKQVMANGEFTGQKGADSVMERWRRETDSIYNFIRTGEEEHWLVEKPEGKAEKEEFYQLCVKFIELEDLGAPPTPTTFTRSLKEMGFPLRHSKSFYYYAGIEIVRENLPEAFAEFRNRRSFE